MALYTPRAETSVSRVSGALLLGLGGLAVAAGMLSLLKEVVHPLSLEERAWAPYTQTTYVLTTGIGALTALTGYYLRSRD